MRVPKSSATPSSWMGFSTPRHRASESSRLMRRPVSSWDLDPRKGQRVTGKQRNRGLTYWTDGTERRLFFGVSNWLYSLERAPVRRPRAFGIDGRIDLREGLGRTLATHDPGE